jgi:hypothetical protein
MQNPPVFVISLIGLAGGIVMMVRSTRNRKNSKWGYKLPMPKSAIEWLYYGFACFLLFCLLAYLCLLSDGGAIGKTEALLSILVGTVGLIAAIVRAIRQ